MSTQREFPADAEPDSEEIAPNQASSQTQTSTLHQPGAITHDLIQPVSPPPLGNGKAAIRMDIQNQRGGVSRPLPEDFQAPPPTRLDYADATTVSDQMRLARAALDKIPQDIDKARRASDGTLRYLNGRKVPREKDPVILERMMQIEELHLMGLTTYQISQQLNVDIGVVKTDLSELQKIWLERVSGRVDELRAMSVAVLRQVQRAAWADHSHLPETHFGAQRNAYLLTISQAEEKIANILGLPKPTKIAFTDPTGEEQYTGLSDDAIVAGITKLLDAARARQLEAPESSSQVPLELAGPSEADAPNQRLLLLDNQGGSRLREDSDRGRNSQDLGED